MDKEEIVQKLCSVLKAVRKIADLSQEDVAKQAGIARQTLINIEKGQITSVAPVMAIIGVYMMIANPLVTTFLATANLSGLVKKLFDKSNEK